MNNNFLERYTPPTKLDIAPYGTLYKEIKDDTDYAYYVQLNPTSDSADWKRLGSILEIVMEFDFLDEDIRKKLLARYKKIVDVQEK